MLCTYMGSDQRTYLDYVNQLTDRVLEVTPGGGSYDVRVASGQPDGLPLPPGDGRWSILPPDAATFVSEVAARLTEVAPPVPAAEAAPASPDAGDSPAEEEN